MPAFFVFEWQTDNALVKDLGGERFARALPFVPTGVMATNRPAQQHRNIA